MYTYMSLYNASLWAPIVVTNHAAPQEPEAHSWEITVPTHQ